MDRFAEVFGEWIGAPVVEEERINCHHNYTEQEEHYGETVWLTRKGAVDAHEGVDAVIPGSMGTGPTWSGGRAMRAGCAPPRTAPAVDSPGRRPASGSPWRTWPTG